MSVRLHRWKRRRSQATKGRAGTIREITVAAGQAELREGRCSGKGGAEGGDHPQGKSPQSVEERCLRKPVCYFFFFLCQAVSAEGIGTCFLFILAVETPLSVAPSLAMCSVTLIK